MSLKPLQPQQVQNTVQILLEYLSDERNSTPNNMVEGITSAKSLLRAIIAGNLVICADEKTAMPHGDQAPQAGNEDVPKKVTRKRKAAPKKAA